MASEHADQNVFSMIGSPRTTWAISSIHAESNRLEHIHDTLIGKIQPGDRFVYLGNYIGHGRNARKTIDEILTFRRNVLAIPGVRPNDFSYLRGSQENMLLKVLQLHYAPNPTETLVWMLGNGLANTLADYGFCPHDGIDVARKGCVELAKWTSSLANKIRSTPGHEDFIMSLKRAAYTEECVDSGSCDIGATPLLFVNAGLDPQKDLKSQGDNFWWAEHDFSTINVPYAPFQKVIRGYDPKHKGVHLNCVTATLDGGCGFGGALVAAAINRSGNIDMVLEI
jgi:hypothetical protein